MPIDITPAPGHADPPALRKRGRFLDRRSPPHLITLVLLAGMSALAMNIFLPSLPRMATHFGVEYRVMQLSVTLYLAVNAVLQIVVGPLSDRYGRRPVLLWSLVLFLVATVGALFAPTAEVFLACRMAQAMIVGAMVLSRAIVSDMVPRDQAASMLGYVTMGMAVVPMLGPVVGGFLDETFGWQASFVFLIVAGLGATALAWADLGETAQSRPTSLRAQFAQYPALLTARRFWGYCAASAFTAGVFFAFLGGAPYVGTEVYGLSPSRLGVYFATPALGYIIGNYLSGRFSRRIGLNRMLIAGALLTFVGLAALWATMAAGLDTAEVFFGSFILVGVGNGLVMPNATAGLLAVRPHLAGTASGLGGAIMIAGGAALSALAAAVLVPGAGAWPLLYIMLVTAAAAIAATLYVVRREQQVGA